MNTHIEEQKFIDFIQSIINRPGMFLVSKVEDLYFVILGFKSGFWIYNNNDAIEKLIYDFRQFVNKEFNSNGDHDWPKLIRFYSNGDKNSLDLFAKVFEEFLLQKSNG